MDIKNEPRGVHEAAQNLRSEALLFFDIARLLSDRVAAEELCSKAFEYLSRAAERDAANKLPSPRPCGGLGNQ